MEERYLEAMQNIEKEYIDENGFIKKKDKYHEKMDYILLILIKNLGYTKIVDEYIKAKVNFYYI